MINTKYADMLDLPHHTSKTRQPMSMHDRAAQFSPFSALTGYEAAVQEAARFTAEESELDLEHIRSIDWKLQILLHPDYRQEDVSILYFVDDQAKSGGAYMNTAGKIVNYDPLKKVLFLDNGAVIPICRIHALDSAVFCKREFE